MNRMFSPRRGPLLGVIAMAGIAALAAAFAVPLSATAGRPHSPATRTHDEVPSTTATLARAKEAFFAKRYADAYGRFAELADAGDTAAAGMALAMVNNGPAIFDSDWSATPGQLRRWTALANRHAQARSTVIAEHDRGE